LHLFAPFGADAYRKRLLRSRLAGRIYRSPEAFACPEQASAKKKNAHGDRRGAGEREESRYSNPAAEDMIKPALTACFAPRRSAARPAQTRDTTDAAN
jgi:hypothetical protein